MSALYGENGNELGDEEEELASGDDVEFDEDTDRPSTRKWDPAPDADDGPDEGDD
jgi:hypothetical protein